jgi:hypothetical protein
VTAVGARSTGPFAGLVTWGRSVRLLGASAGFVGVLGLFTFSGFARDAWGIYAFLVVLTCGLFADARQRLIAPRFDYLQALPIGASSRTLLVLPEILVAGLIIAAGSWRAFGPLHAFTLWGCCAWAIATSHFFPIRRWWRFFPWLAIVGVGALVAGIAHGDVDGADAWRRAAIAAVAMGGLGFLLAPRALRRRATRCTTQVPAGAALGPAAVSAFRPSNRRVGLVRLWRLSVPAQNVWIPGLGALIFLITALLVLRSDEWRHSMIVVISWPAMFGGAVANATSRRVTEFLGTRPIGRARLLVTMVVPWFAMAFVPALLVFKRELTAAPVHGLGVHEMSARVALTSLTLVLFSGAEPTKGARFDPFTFAVSFIIPVGLIAWTAAWIVGVDSARRSFPGPPLWSLSAVTVAAGVYWYRRALRR